MSSMNYSRVQYSTVTVCMVGAGGFLTPSNVKLVGIGLCYAFVYK